MGLTLTITAPDGQAFQAYRADPAIPPKGAVVVLQEIFGVNRHIRRVTDDFAAQGYLAIAPALFDRVEPGIDLDYGPADIERGRALMQACALESVLADIAATVALAGAAGKVGLVGYCWGGTLAWLAAGSVPGLAGAVSYYGGRISQFLDRTPKVPILLHFGREDHGIPLTEVDAIAARYPDLPIHLYPAGHGFNCDLRPSFHPESAQLALARTTDFFAKILA